MPTNDFQTFACGAGANVLTQSAYLTLAAKATGFQSGVAQSIQLNKVWRQSSIMSSMIGQFICDKSGQNSTDDGTIATLEANFITAVQNSSRIRATGIVNLYVSPSGSDLNSGTSNATPLQNIQTAVNIFINYYDMAGFAAQINLAAGTYSQTVSINQVIPGCPYILIQGVVGSPSAVVIIANNASGIVVSAGYVVIQWLQVGATGTQTIPNPGVGFGIAASQAYVSIANVVLGSCGTAQLLAEDGGVITANYQPVTFGGTSLIGCYAAFGYVYMANAPLTFQAGTTYSNQFALSTTTGIANFTIATFTGSFTGQRFYVNLQSQIIVNGAGPNFLPGTIAGVADPSTYGLYI